MQKQKNLSLWRNLKENILLTTPSHEIKFSKFFLGNESLPSATLIIHQYCIDKLLTNKLYFKILQSLSNRKSVVYPLPRKWYSCFVGLNIKISRLSIFAFYLFVILNYIKSVFFGISLIFAGPILEKPIIPKRKKVHFLNVLPNNFPSSVESKFNFDLFTWYLTNRNSNVNILHDLKNGLKSDDYINSTISYSVNPAEVIYGFVNRLNFSLWFFFAALICFFDFVRGKWYSALIFKEAIKAKVVRINTRMADEYLFPYSGQSYMPMWVNELKPRKIIAICYFYATFEQPSIDSEPINNEFYLYNWPHTFFWNNFQLLKIKQSSPYFYSGEIVGPIWYSDNSEILNESTRPFIVIFDIPPHRKYFHFSTSTLTEYFENNDNVYLKFLQDIVSCAQELNILVIHKTKRDIGERSVKKYTSLLRKLKNSSYYESASPDISPIKLIDKSIAVISMPFTSTAIYGRHRNKPSIYYDPVNWIRQNDIAAHDIPIITGKDGLKFWLLNILQHGANGI